jgi:hypothetical protein
MMLEAAQILAIVGALVLLGEALSGSKLLATTTCMMLETSLPAKSKARLSC